jgi:hypothetical protein
MRSGLRPVIVMRGFLSAWRRLLSLLLLLLLLLSIVGRIFWVLGIVGSVVACAWARGGERADRERVGRERGGGS